MEMKRKKLVIVAIALLIISTVILVGVFNAEKRKIERNYNIDLPKSADVMYMEDTTGWFGDGSILSIVQLDDESDEYISNLFYSMNNGKPSEQFNDSEFEDKIDKILREFFEDLPTEYMISWSDSYQWTEGASNSSSLYWIYNDDANILYVVEVRT